MKHKYYLDCPFEALYMAKKFGVHLEYISSSYLTSEKMGINHSYSKFIKSNRPGMTPSFFVREYEEGEKIYVTHEDPEFFEPKHDDISKDGAERFCMYMFDKWIMVGRGTSPVYPVEIIERDNKHFFWPKIEMEEVK